MAENDDEKRKKLQKRYVEYQMLEHQIKQMQQQLERLEAQTAEVAAVTQSIEDISKAKKGTEVLVPVSGGIFFKASLNDSNTFLVNVGGGVVVKKDLESTKQLLKEQSNDLDSYKSQISEQLAKQLMDCQKLEIELKEMMQE